MRSPTTATVAAALLLGVSSLAIAADNTSGGPTAPSAATSGAVTGTIVTTPMATEATN
jgi:Spy/CpxP family protein refolding chaperone